MSQRESRYVKVAKIGYRLCKQALPKYSHAKSPHHFELPQLAACVLLMFYLNKSYRDMEEWLLATDKVCQALELPRIPDHTTLQRTYRKLRWSAANPPYPFLHPGFRMSHFICHFLATPFSMVQPHLAQFAATDNPFFIHRDLPFFSPAYTPHRWRGSRCNRTALGLDVRKQYTPSASAVLAASCFLGFLCKFSAKPQ